MRDNVDHRHPSVPQSRPSFRGVDLHPVEWPSFRAHAGTAETSARDNDSESLSRLTAIGFFVAVVERIDQNRCERLRLLDRSSPAANADYVASRPTDSPDI
ncbi:hypothetical protein [Lysobacter sp. 22409]|uniref:hypothetical protein n=1 Tax=Lysobacter sp. 22409 TaxID=3453917 RepID=UPI003F87A68E